MAAIHHFLPLLIALIVICHFGILYSQTVETRALLEFKQQLNDPMNYLESWTDSVSPCQFVGITCDSAHKVIGIMLMNKSLSGQISPSISALQSLQSLHLGTNSISGVLPPQLTNCSNLQFLNVSPNHLTGNLPDLSQLRNLQLLDVSTNWFSGSFPTWVANLSGLTQLGLAQNNFDEGEVPPSIGNLKNLTWLFLAQCNLTGEIPSTFSQLTLLGTLDLSTNNISGAFPKWISSLRSLWKIEIYVNNLTGEIPREFADLTLLQEVDFSRNQLSGKLPPEIGNLRHLTLFQAYQNNFWGDFPQGFGTMQFLKTLSIYENNFSGQFPATLGQFSPLNGIDISENSFSGPFPRFLCQNKSLQFLLALNNDFSGDFPDSYSDCKSLQRFRISQNSLTGKFPGGLWGLPSALVFDVADNKFTGGITSEIGVSASLTQLYVQNNQFSGQIPAEIGQLYQLQKLVVSNNSFSGPIPSQMGGLTQLTSLHMEHNSFTESIPSELSRCSMLVDLDLAQNSLSGDIPQSLSSLTSLNSFNLSNNRLTGSIPVGLQYLKLSLVDLSKNQLSGEIPPGLLMIAGDEAFSGNAGLCIDGNSLGQSARGIGICHFNPEHEGMGQRRMVLILVIMLVLFVLLSGLVYVSYKSFKLEQSCKRVDVEADMEDDSKWKLESFHPTELDAEEICNLEEDNLIGNGGAGKVYRLELSKNRGTVAVKKLWKGNGSKALMAEIGILGKIRHRNILKLYACLLKGETSFLVFEYMQNGNLFEALRREIKGGQPELDWYKRYSIAVGAAKGLMYLHHDCSPAIIHRDIKSTNILLDEEYEAKLADFGIAKLAEGSDNSCFAGTHGYMAPELAYSLKVTEKSDVYSFGIVLLELLTGRNPADPQFGEGKDIVYWVSSHLYRQKAEEVLHPQVRESSAEDMTKVLRVAILCTTKLPSLRPSMREVVNMLVDADPCGAVSRVKSFVKNC